MEPFFKLSLVEGLPSFWCFVLSLFNLQGANPSAEPYIGQRFDILALPEPLVKTLFSTFRNFFLLRIQVLYQAVSSEL